MRKVLIPLLAVCLLGAGKSPGTADKQLRQLFESDWRDLMRESPEWATWAGEPGQNGRWSDLSPAGIAKARQHAKDYLRKLKAIPRAQVSAAERLNYDLAVRDTEESIKGQAFPSELLPINQMGGAHQDIAQLLSMQPAATVSDYKDIISRLNGVPTVIDQTIALMEEGLKRGITPPKVTLRDVPDQIAAQIVDDAAKSPMLEAFKEFPAAVPAAEQAALKSEAAKVYQTKVAPAFQKLRQFFVESYLPKTTENIALSALPGGKEWYAYRVRKQTTTLLTPAEIHALGHAEVKRIRGEMDAIIQKLDFKGTFAEFTQFLRTDEQFFYKDADSLLAGYRDIAKRVDPELVKVFGKIPRLPYGIKAVPPYAEKSQTTAYYNQGSLQAGRPGTFFANTYDLKARPKWEMEALTLHEAVPGHHLQIALAQEMENVPRFRQESGYTAFVEGWGLYSESLGTEMGFYKDPYAKFGQLTYEIWRAIRLVVDTGIHSMGWTRQQAIDFFRSNSSKADHDIEVEVDRYIVWPGQALAYKIGELKIKELRRRAAETQGKSFDVREFHDELLGNGALPLDILEDRMNAWIKAPKNPASH